MRSRDPRRPSRRCPSYPPRVSGQATFRRVEDRQRQEGSRRAALEELAPGSGIVPQIDRGAWMALSQGAPGTWSWGRAAITLGLAAVLVVVLYLAVDSSID